MNKQRLNEYSGKTLEFWEMFNKAGSPGMFEKKAKRRFSLYQFIYCSFSKAFKLFMLNGNRNSQIHIYSQRQNIMYIPIYIKNENIPVYETITSQHNSKTVNRHVCNNGYTVPHCEGIQQGRQRVELRINITRADWAISILMTFGPVGF